jgi:hypothetical protein
LWFLLGAVRGWTQSGCDSLYAQETAMRAGNVSIVWFDQPPQIIVGSETLHVYNVPKNQGGEAIFSVLVDEHGQPICLRWVRVTNEAIRGEANAIVSALRFSPALSNGKPLRVSMTLPVRFLEGPAPNQKGLRKAHGKGN